MKTRTFEIPTTTGFFNKPTIRRILKAARRLWPGTYFSPPGGDSITMVFPEPVSAPEFLDEALGLCRLHEFTYVGDPRLTYVCESCQQEQEEWNELWIPTPPTFPDPELADIALPSEEELEDITLTSADFALGELSQLERWT